MRESLAHVLGLPIKNVQIGTISHTNSRQLRRLRPSVRSLQSTQINASIDYQVIVPPTLSPQSVATDILLMGPALQEKSRAALIERGASVEVVNMYVLRPRVTPSVGLSEFDMEEKRHLDLVILLYVVSAVLVLVGLVICVLCCCRRKSLWRQKVHIEQQFATKQSNPGKEWREGQPNLEKELSEEALPEGEQTVPEEHDNPLGPWAIHLEEVDFSGSMEQQAEDHVARTKSKSQFRFQNFEFEPVVATVPTPSITSSIFMCCTGEACTSSELAVLNPDVSRVSSVDFASI